MKVVFLLIALVTASQAVPRKRHFLDQVGPIARKPLSVGHSGGAVEKNELEIPPDIPEINRDKRDWKPERWAPYNVNRKEGMELMQGDLMSGPQSRNTMDDDWTPEYFWTSTNIPVEYHGLGLLAKAAIDEARKEYELRTCFSLPDRTDETDYITFRPLGGCWSYIGMQGGAQNISIGPGCERIGTIEHEIMHALGIWHEQSRADRDEYVEIMWDKIREGSENNFNSYDYELTDDRRVPYDYYSVMHYSKSGFTIDGNVTIRTRDPQFQNVIGQRGGFSESDVTKIGRMYGCSDTVRITNNVNYEDEAEGGYSQHGLNSDVNWIQHKLGISDTNGPTTRYLPDFDSTHGMHDEGSFMYLDTTDKFSGLSGVLKSMRYESVVEHQCLEFSYFMDLDQFSDAAITVYIASIDSVTGEVTNYGQPIQTFTGNSGTEWSVYRMTISAPSLYKVIFYAKTSWYASDVIAIDDVTVKDKECDTSYFMIENYSEKASTYAVDQFEESPIMYTGGDSGYAFKVLVYPNGSQSAVDDGYTDYMSVYFQLCGGPDDDTLEWPFDNQYIRLMITDQGPNPLTRINHYSNFLTSSASLQNASYEMPSGLNDCNKEVGYRTFMRKEQFYRRMYLKHDVAYFSVMVTDMRPYDNGEMSLAKLTNPTLRKRSPKPPQGVKFDLAPPSEMKFDLHSSLDLSNKEEPDFGLNKAIDKPNAHDYITEPTVMPYPVEEQNDDEMIPIITAAIIVLCTAFGVFLTMSIVICCVASSYKKAAKATRVTSKVNFINLDTLKYSSLKGKI